MEHQNFIYITIHVQLQQIQMTGNRINNNTTRTLILILHGIVFYRQVLNISTRVKLKQFRSVQYSHFGQCFILNETNDVY